MGESVPRIIDDLVETPKKALIPIKRQVDAAMHTTAEALMHDPEAVQRFRSEGLLQFVDAHLNEKYKKGMYRAWGNDLLEGALGLQDLTASDKYIQIMFFQKLLNRELGLNLDDDGKLGPKTLRAMRKYCSRFLDSKRPNKPKISNTTKPPVTKKPPVAVEFRAPITDKNNPRKTNSTSVEKTRENGFIKIEHPKYGEIYAWKNPRLSGDPKEIVVCLHGHGDSPKGMINRNGLLDQFRNSGKNALFLVPGALRGKSGKRTWQSTRSKPSDFNEIIKLASEATKTNPKKRITLMAHSGAYVTMLSWLKGGLSNSVHNIALLCSTQGYNQWPRTVLNNWLSKNSKNKLTFIISNSKGRMPGDVQKYTQKIQKYYTDAAVNTYDRGLFKRTNARVNYYLAKRYSHNQVPKLISKVLSNFSGSKVEGLV